MCLRSQDRLGEHAPSAYSQFILRLSSGDQADMDPPEDGSSRNESGGFPKLGEPFGGHYDIYHYFVRD